MTGDQRAWAWVDHLRAGGTTPWLAFEGACESRGSLLPGAIQLEVARRVNLVRRANLARRADLATDLPADAAHTALVDRILASSAPGRGQPDLRLVGLDHGARFGPRPVDPASVAAEELLRMAVGVLADLVVDAGAPRGKPARSVPRPWRRGFHLVGNPLVADGVATALGPPGLRRPVAVVLADDLGGMLADLWSWRIQHIRHPSWRWWLEHWAARDRLPPRLDLPAVAATWADRVGRDNVHVVVGRDPAAEVARLVGVRRPLAPSYTSLSPEATDLLRRLNGVLRVLIEPARHQDLLDQAVLPLLRPEQGGRAAVPEKHRDWVREQAERVRDGLLGGGYAVHGDPDALLPPDEGASPAGPTDRGVLEVALRTLLRAKEMAR